MITERQKYQYIAILAGIFSLLAFSHLVIQVYLTKKTGNLTLAWCILTLLANILLTIYGINYNAFGIYIPSTIHLLGVTYILIVKIYYEEVPVIEKDVSIAELNIETKVESDLEKDLEKKNILMNNQ